MSEDRYLVDKDGVPIGKGFQIELPPIEHHNIAIKCRTLKGAAFHEIIGKLLLAPRFFFDKYVIQSVRYNSVQDDTPGLGGFSAELVLQSVPDPDGLIIEGYAPGVKVKRLNVHKEPLIHPACLIYQTREVVDLSQLREYFYSIELPFHPI